MRRFDQVIERLIGKSSLIRSVHEWLQTRSFGDPCFSPGFMRFSPASACDRGPLRHRRRRSDDQAWKDLTRGWRRMDAAVNPREKSAKLICAQVLGAVGRNMERDLFSQRIPPQRPASRLHELPSRPLPGRLAGHDPALDRRGPHQLLPHPGRSAALFASPARRFHLLDAGRRARSARDRGSPRRLSNPSRHRAPSSRHRTTSATGPTSRHGPRAQLARRPNFSRRRR
jgi:hypothetical protein